MCKVLILTATTIMVLALVSGCDAPMFRQDLATPPKTVNGEIGHGGAHASAYGAWRDFGETRSPTPNAASISCWTVPSGVCVEAEAQVAGGNLLMAFSRIYEIVSVSPEDRSIRAKSFSAGAVSPDGRRIPPYAEWELRVSLGDSMVTRVRRDVKQDGTVSTTTSTLQ